MDFYISPCGQIPWGANINSVCIARGFIMTFFVLSIPLFYGIKYVFTRIVAIVNTN